MKEKGTVSSMIQQLTGEAVHQLFCYPEMSVKEQGKYLLKRLLRPSRTPPKDPFFWPQALLAQALEEAGEEEVLRRYYQGWLAKGLPLKYTDGAMNGYSLLWLYHKTKEPALLQAAGGAYSYLSEMAGRTGGYLIYREHSPQYILADGLGMACPFLARYGAMTGNKEALALAAGQLGRFLKQGMDEATGLPYHGYNRITKEKMGIIGWGRAVGWLALAFADSLEYFAENEEKEKLTGAFRQLMEEAMKKQRGDGYFSWQLAAVEGPKDSSATAMLAYALEKGGRIGVLPRDGGSAIGALETGKGPGRRQESLNRLEQALFASAKDGGIYDCLGECKGFGEYPQVYGAYPWSLGPALRFLLLRQKGKGG